MEPDEIARKIVSNTHDNAIDTFNRMRDAIAAAIQEERERVDTETATLEAVRGINAANVAEIIQLRARLEKTEADLKVARYWHDKAQDFLRLMREAEARAEKIKKERDEALTKMEKAETERDEARKERLRWKLEAEASHKCVSMATRAVDLANERINSFRNAALDEAADVADQWTQPGTPAHPCWLAIGNELGKVRDAILALKQE